MTISPQQAQEMLERLERNKHRKPHPIGDAGEEYPGRMSDKAVDREMKLHAQIMKWADSQWPPVPYIRARPDKPSGIAEGTQDFTLFIGGKVVCCECKKREKKPSGAQLAWHHMMANQGFTVHIIYNIEQFLALVTSSTPVVPRPLDRPAECPPQPTEPSSCP